MSLNRLLPPLITLVALVWISVADAFITDPRYHTVDEINARIFALQDSFPDWVRVDSIGHSQQEHLPIYAVKISSEVDDSLSEHPAVIFIGQVHAEEVLGVEYAMWLMDKMVSRQGKDWRNRIDTWIVPTDNPEGLNVVYSLDYTYRKNKRDNIGDGLFRLFTGLGNDTSGVDVNRNFPFFWTSGDGLLRSGKDEPYDYYRGPTPLSEAESVALDRLNDRVRPVYTVVLHSSRSGLFAEKVIYPWDFGVGSQIKKSPDITMIAETANRVASRCRKYSGSGTYEPSFILTPIGDSDAYLYYRYGSFSYRIEIGGAAEDMQPDSTGIVSVLEGIQPGMEYFLNSAAGVTSEGADIHLTRLFLQIGDAATGAPLEAHLILQPFTTPLIPYRTTNRVTGVYHWIVPDDFHDTLTISKFGWTTRRGLVTAAPSPRRPLRITLDPLLLSQITLQAVTANGLPIPDNLELAVEHIWAPSTFGFSAPIQIPPVTYPSWHPSDSVWTQLMPGGRAILDLPEGGYRFTVLKGSRFVPRCFDLTVDSSRTWTINMARAAVLLDQNFDGGDVLFTSDNVMNRNTTDSLAHWELSSDVYHTPPRSLTDSELGNTPILEDAWAAPYNLLDRPFNLSSSRSAALVYWLNQALEPGYDSLTVESSFGGASGSDPNSWTWTQLAPAHQELSQLENVPIRPWNAPPINYQRYAPWRRFVIPLDSLCGHSVVHIRFHLKTDIGVQQDGVYIDDVMLLASTESPPAVASETPLPQHFALGDPYPNPFNSRLSVAVALPEPSRVRLDFYDLTGRRALAALDAELSAGAHRLTVDAGSLPAGLYLMRAATSSEQAVRKVMLLK
jgi:hypothetical protein